MHRVLKPLVLITAFAVFVTGAIVALSMFNQPTSRSGSIAAFDSANTVSDPNWFKKAYKDGFRLYILHATSWGTCAPWPQAQKQAQMALDAGIAIAAYTRDPRCFEEGIKALGALQSKLQFFALDIETDPGIPVTRAMINGVKSLGIRPVIYTGSGMWPSIMQDSHEYSDIPLWDTDASQFPIHEWQIDYMRPTPTQFGGWNTSTTMRIGVQQQFEYTLHGVKVDINSFNSSFIRDV